VNAIAEALRFAFGMAWEIAWALILGFALSGAVQAVVSKQQMRRLLPDNSPRTLAIASGLGAASSSCSYAAVALARSLFRKGADFTSAMARAGRHPGRPYRLAVHRRRVRRRPDHDRGNGAAVSAFPYAREG
jgi:hypothetical protein